MPLRQSWTAAFVTLLGALALFGCLRPVGPSTPPPPNSICGNNDRQANETCDGDDLNGKSCEDLGFGAGSLGCKATCDNYDRSACGAPASCGDGNATGVEICDGAAVGEASCESLGYGAGSLACLPNCADYDVSGCGPPPDCGDGKKRGVEVCDGDDFDGLSCPHLGFAGGELRCASDCLSIDTSGCTAGGSDAGPGIDHADICPSGKDCSGRACGPDPVCNLSCGTCPSGSCVNGQCQPSDSDAGPGCPATQDCGGRACGLDPVCGLSCGTCSSGNCVNGQCQASGDDAGPGPDSGPNCPADKDCTGLSCGFDPVCGLSCGSCGGSSICVGGACQSNQLCNGYSSGPRLDICTDPANDTCTAPFSCEAVTGGITNELRCLDARPCAASPMAACCGTGEFCGQSSSLFATGLFCCKPGEIFASDIFLGDAICADSGRAIGCRGDADCPADWGRGHCATSLNPPICVECLSNSHCGGDTPGCDTGTHTCVECTLSSHCGGSTPYCSDQNRCVNCTSDSQCGGSTPGCSASGGCVECTREDHCGGATPGCDTTTHNCVECTQNSHCSGATPYCQGTSCVECLNSSHCGGGSPFCHSNGNCQPCPESLVPMLGSYACTSLEQGGRGCYPTGFLEPSGQQCANSGDCSDGKTCGAPVGKHKDCIIPCQ